MFYFFFVLCWLFFFSSRRRHTICALGTGVQTCALPICEAALLQRKVQVVKGMNRKDTLVAMAKATGVTINLSNGNTVVVSPAQIGTVPGITVQEKIGRASCRERVCQYV